MAALALFLLVAYRSWRAGAPEDPGAYVPPEPFGPAELALAEELRAADSDSNPNLSAGAEPSRPPSFIPFHRGVALGLHSRDADYDYGTLLREIAEHGADHVSLVFAMPQRDGRSNSMGPLAGVETQERVLLAALRRAREVGLEPMLLPIVPLTHPRGDEWRGRLAPDDPAAWFAAYRAHVVRLAALSARERLEWFCVGSEFASLESREADWRALIAAVREVFPGRLTYSANWDRLESTPFWDALDAVGVSGYWALTDRLDPSPEELRLAWERRRNRLLSWRRATVPTLPILFTEVGYPNLDGAARRPWDHASKGTPDPAEQAACLEAFARAWHGVPELGGVYVYDWFGRADPADPGYSPRGKPASRVLRAWYGATAPRSVPLPR